MRKKIIFLLAVISLTGCAKFSEGDCLQNVKDGFIWRVSKVHFYKYTVQGWFDGKWGLSVDGPFDTFDSHYVKISCSFSTQTPKEEK